MKSKLLLLQVMPGESDIEVLELAAIKEHPTRDHMRIATFKRMEHGRAGTTVHPDNGQVIGQLAATPFHIDPNPTMRCWCTAKTRKAATKNLLLSSLDFVKDCVEGWNDKATILRRKLDKL